ncbi:hypothetical protein Pla163_07410 [Planctomycetes bacterium Pla163]|uniref:Uncharacterized protein n=1 Tax=Rohdeia mirabilis TaxID=2528008 RepID=A0A518CWN3_9BACT|nr:hypothetical protein Pla163_07410 [Planctomycetes bacterium Pla163]
MNEQTEDRWDVQLEDAAPPKRGVPIWVWGCGGGCLFMLVAAIVFTMWFGNKLMNMFGPEAAWPVIAEVMPYAEDGATEEELVAARPPGYQPVLFPISQLADMVGAEGEDISAGGGVSLDSLVFLSPGEDPSQPAGTGLATMIFVFDGLVEGDPLDWIVSEFKLEENDTATASSRGRARASFQGREVDTFHMRVEPDGNNKMMLPGGGDPQGLLFVDATGDRTRTVVITCVATGEVDATLEGLSEQLFPFRVWDGK